MDLINFTYIPVIQKSRVQKFLSIHTFQVKGANMIFFFRNWKTKQTDFPNASRNQLKNVKRLLFDLVTTFNNRKHDQ